LAAKEPKDRKNCKKEDQRNRFSKKEIKPQMARISQMGIKEIRSGLSIAN
jgi:hypothetical protein